MRKTEGIARIAGENDESDYAVLPTNQSRNKFVGTIAAAFASSLDVANVKRFIFGVP
jgi:hypothetical protein